MKPQDQSSENISNSKQYNSSALKDQAKKSEQVPARASAGEKKKSEEEEDDFESTPEKKLNTSGDAGLNQKTSQFSTFSSSSQNEKKNLADRKDNSDSKSEQSSH